MFSLQLRNDLLGLEGFVVDAEVGEHAQERFQERTFHRVTLSLFINEQEQAVDRPRLD